MSSERARSFRRTQYKKSAKARLEEITREITTARHEREAAAGAQGTSELDESIKLLHDKHAALEIWSEELRCGDRERSRSRSASRQRGDRAGGDDIAAPMNVGTAVI